MHRGRAIQLLLEQFHEIEKEWEDVNRRRRLLLELRAYLFSLRNHTELDLAPVTELCEKVDENISLPYLYGLVVPIEREHARTNITDEDFVVATSDATEREAAIMPVTVIVDNVRSAFNVGGIFRSSECLGVERVVLCGYTATPENDKVRRSSLGAEAGVPWEHHHTAGAALAAAREQDRTIVALETAEGCRAPHEIDYGFPGAVVVGNERFGLSRDVLKAADHVVRIPTCGRKNSLNVVSAFTVCGYEIRRQWDARQTEQNGGGR
jgi:tRNA G18 (ribose-2'-O)-methylase SpoU